MKLAAILYLFFGLLALGLGIAMLIDATLLNQFGGTVRTIFIVLLFAYGIYRLWTAIGAMRKTSNRQTSAQ